MRLFQAENYSAGRCMAGERRSEMTESNRTPWHKAVRLRDDLRTGELSLATLAADLYDVVMG